MGIVWEQCCMCPVYVWMPHATYLGLQEFQQIMVVDVVVVKISSCEYVVTKIELRMDVAM